MTPTFTQTQEYENSQHEFSPQPIPTTVERRHGFRYEEISEEAYNALPENEKYSNVVMMPVFGLRLNSDDGEIGGIIEGFEWIEDYPSLGITPKSADPMCLESLSQQEGKPIQSMMLGDIPGFSTLNTMVATENGPGQTVFMGRYYRDYIETLAAWKLSQNQDPSTPLFDPYNYPHEPLRDENGEIITDENGVWIFEQDEAGNPTLTWPFPRKSSSFDPASVQIRTAYFHLGDGR